MHSGDNVPPKAFENHVDVGMVEMRVHRHFLSSFTPTDGGKLALTPDLKLWNSVKLAARSYYKKRSHVKTKDLLLILQFL